jgi:hypothetical protein
MKVSNKVYPGPVGSKTPISKTHHQQEMKTASIV